MIEARGLVKRYGSTTAVDNLSFDVRPGTVTGFLGPNGAGKSTTMRMMIGLDQPDAGTVRINGKDYRDLRSPLREVGALLEAKAFHPGRTARAHLAALAASNDIPRRRVNDVLEITGMDKAADRRAGKFSLGMAQRLGIAAALLGDPAVLLLDEPVNGLDPEGIRWIRLARGINTADRSLIRGLLGPTSMAERVSELERTRTLAVEDSAAALRRVERDLHDGAQMRLAALAMNLGMAREKLGEDDEQPEGATVRELIDAAHRNAVDALADLRDLARGIHPPVLDSGLASALATLAASSAIPASVTADIDPRPAPAIETIAYFCAAELIANATKHSYANQIKIKISTERTGVLLLEVSDDGIGGADTARGSGLAGLAQRVSTVDGRIDMVSPTGGPTTVTVELPLRA